jgi:hypothetical protein
VLTLKNLLLTTLNNLKVGLIANVQTNGTPNKVRPSQYQPKTKTITREENSGTNDSNGKYINPAAYKQRLKNKK